MSFHVELTPQQARAVAALAEEHASPVALRQLVSPSSHVAEDDVYAAVRGHTQGFRISRDGEVYTVDDVLPAP